MAPNISDGKCFIALLQAVEDLDGLCLNAVTSVGRYADRHQRSKDFLEELKNLVRGVLECEAVAIFLVNRGGDRLELAATTGTGWREDLPEEEQFYRLGEGLTGWVWANNEPLLSPNTHEEAKYIGKSEDGVLSEGQHSCIFVPFVDVSRGRVVGVVRCSNRSTPAPVARNLFSDDDVAVLDAIGQAAVPYLLKLRDDEGLTAHGAAPSYKAKLRVLGVPVAPGGMTWVRSLPESFGLEPQPTSSSVVGQVLEMVRAAKLADVLESRLSLETHPTSRPARHSVEPLTWEHDFEEISVREVDFDPDSYARLPLREKLRRLSSYVELDSPDLAQILGLDLGSQPVGRIPDPVQSRPADQLLSVLGFVLQISGYDPTRMPGLWRVKDLYRGSLDKPPWDELGLGESSVVTS